jgi:hypothetical protein
MFRRLLFSRRRQVCPPLKFRMPRLESLEIRGLLAKVNWPGGGDRTSCSNAANWRNNTLPGPTDDVVINAAPGVTVTHDSGADTVKSLTSLRSFTLSGGTLTVDKTVEVDSTFMLSGGTLAESTVELGSGVQGVTITAFSFYRWTLTRANHLDSTSPSCLPGKAAGA